MLANPGRHPQAHTNRVKRHCIYNIKYQQPYLNQCLNELELIIRLKAVGKFLVVEVASLRDVNQITYAVVLFLSVQVICRN